MVGPWYLFEGMVKLTDKKVLNKKVLNGTKEPPLSADFTSCYMKIITLPYNTKCFEIYLITQIAYAKIKKKNNLTIKVMRSSIRKYLRN